MKRILACCLIALLACCGCDAGGKPEPIHLDGRDTGLSVLLPGTDSVLPETTTKPTESDVLEQLLNAGSALTVPEVEGFDTQSLYQEYLSLKDEVEKALADKGADSAILQTRIRQAQETLSLIQTQVEEAREKGALNETQTEQLKAFVSTLQEEMSGWIEQLKRK